MNKDNRNILKGVSKNLPANKPTDENKPKNVFKVQLKKDILAKPSSKPIEPVLVLQQQPLTSYRHKPTPEEIQTRKWQCLTRFQQLTSRVHYMHYLKNATLFLSYSLAEKTINLVLNETLSFEYWAACCMFMPMKYEEIYPPRLKDLQPILKISIDLKQYWDAEITIWEQIGMDMNFVSLNTRLSEYLHAINKQERFFMFYLLELTIYKRIKFRKYTEKELVLAVAYLFAFKKFTPEKEDYIDGTPFQIIQECAKKILLCRNQCQSQNLVYRKYQGDNKDCVSLKEIPYLEGVRNLLAQKLNEPERPPRIVGFYESVKESEMIDESEEMEVKEVKKKRVFKVYIKQL